ncbi:MAG: phenylalanine--tRNA ligase subunit alpha [Microgenomates group bacterium]
MREEELEKIKSQVNKEIKSATSLSEIETFRIKYLGRKGIVSQLITQLPKIDPQERKTYGQKINELKKLVENLLEEQKKKLLKEKEEWFDVTFPGKKIPLGHLHLITYTIREIVAIFEKIGFTRVRYPEVEWDWYPFEGLNMPKNHPARDEWETFFIKDLKHPQLGEAVLTPHTSSGQLREMEKFKPPIRMLNIAKCYRRQSDASHAPMFYQFEGLLIDKNVSITHLKGTLEYFAKQYFGPDRKTRIRPFHFQFTEPSFEFDVTCIVCGGKGKLANGEKCKVCKEGWMELGGSGMVHPKVLKNGGIDPEKYTGFAWGWGVERLFMMKYGIDDIRLLFSGDLRFLEQF